MIGLVAGALAAAAAIAMLFDQGDSSAKIEPPKVAVTEAPQVEMAPPPVEVAPPPEPGTVVDQAIASIEEEQAEANPAPKPLIEEAPKATKSVGKHHTRRKPRPTADPGTINLVTRGGWAEVFKGKKSLGSTPTRLTLPAGRHRLMLKPLGTGKPKQVFVEVEAGRTKQVSIRLE